MRLVRLVATLLLMLAGVLACVYGALVFASIDSSDTATSSLVETGLILVLPGIAAIAGGAWLLRRQS